MVWRRETVIRLISLYKKKTVLWNPNDPNYKDRAAKRKAWAELASVLKMNTKVVETKMRGLIGQFQRELRKGKSVCGGKTLYFSEWVFFTKFLFLREKTEAKFAGMKTRTPSPSDKDIVELQKINYSLLLGQDFNPATNPKRSSQTVSNQSQRTSKCSTGKLTSYIPPAVKLEDFDVIKVKEEPSTDLTAVISTGVTTTFSKGVSPVVSAKETACSTGVTATIQPPVTRSIFTSEECEGIVALWISKIKKLDEVQRVLAENLITQVFTKAYFLQLTKNTQILDVKFMNKDINSLN